MKYASTRNISGTEVLAVVLPLDAVPLWNQNNPPPGTFLVPDHVSTGWIRHADGSFSPPANPSYAQVWGYIKAKRDRLSELGGTPVQIDGITKWFHSDAKSRTQQLALVMLASDMPSGILWKTIDGSFVMMTPQIAQSVFHSAVAQDRAIFEAAERHRVAMEASAQPWDYDFSTGWPATYAGTDA